MVQSYEEDFLVSDDNGAPRPQRWGKAALAVGAACALLLVGFATGSHFWSSQAFSKEVAPIGLSQIAVIPPRQECAKTGVNCIAQKCCKTTGYQCYQVHSGYAKCMKSCTPGKDGDCFLHAQPMVDSKRSPITNTANTLFCFNFYTADTGSTKPSFELDLLRTQLFLGASIFGCEEYRVYSDVETWISPAPKVINTIKVNDVEGNFHFEKRKRSGTWINSNMFIQTWKMIKDEGAWSKWDWTVKVDIDAIFLPIRLRKYLANIDDCKTALNYMGHEKATGDQAWGEDLFQQRCMDLHGVDKIGAYDINTDASCAAWRPEGEKKNRKWKPDCSITMTPGIHHFKEPEAYFKCLKATPQNW